ncbi:hypothetical protein G5T42_00950 [Microbacterium sp. 4R-513]|uniref:hypothetical protein n=1 Tax=Microbacterium sp. 4R-513 TaxID=2567934 RepID=UPI0013E1C32D|nr:hypothetical protein [Microbacterium sp. 4R-513]QIG38220.1 hypothetical protein G5T42_00950 [Microbacterium sp. 4R-513]
MKVLAYAGGHYLTGDDIAVALLEYSRALADVGSAASVEIPILSDDGSREEATFLVGPASQIVVTHADASVDELVDAETVNRLKSLTRALHPIAMPVEAEDRVQDFDTGI